MPTHDTSLARERLKLELLRAQLTMGVEALDRGDFVTLDESDLEHFLATGRPRRRKRSR
jgi:hypothetical protein